MPRNHFLLAFLLSAALCPHSARAQQNPAASLAAHSVETDSLPDAPSAAQSSSQSAPPSQPGTSQQPPAETAPNSKLGQELQRKQTKRILGIIPNFRSVTVDEKLPPITAHEKFKLGFYDTFDYSDFIYVGILSGISEAQNSYPEFHKGVPGYARYYWHSFADTLDGNLMTEFILPVVTHEDPRLYTLGRGNVFKRTGYIASRLVITRSDSGHSTPNISEIVGNGAAAGIATLYYPSPERTWTKTGQRWVTQIALDGFANVVKEFWPDINAKIFHNHD
jgi:hypothetical protein